MPFREESMMAKLLIRGVRWVTFLLLFMLACLAVLPIASAQAEAYSPPPETGTVVIDGIYMDFKQQPLVVGGTAMLPFRELFQALGLSVAWDNKAKSVTGSKPGLTIQLGLTDSANVNGESRKLSQAPFLRKGTLYVGLRFVGEATGAIVSWDNANKNVWISTAGTGRLKGLSLKDLQAFTLLHADWTKAQMEEQGFTKTVNDPGGETYYADSDNGITYTFVDYLSPTTGVVDVRGDVAGPRGIRVGDTFEQVMSLFPQDSDWRSSDEGGLFYGTYNPYKGYPIGLTGSVRADDTAKTKEITFSTEKIYPFLRVFLEDDIVTHYTIFLVDGD